MKKVFASSTLKSLVTACAVAASALTPLASAPAAAGDRGYYGGSRCYDIRDCDGYYGPAVRRHHGPKKHYRRHDRVENDAAAAAILGLAGVAIIAGALSNANPPVRHYRVAPNPYPPARSGPNVITYESRLEPWSPGWYRWCDARYRSFNPQTGTFRGYDGLDHFCVPN